MNDKAQKLYDLYLSQGLITEATSFDRFSSATSDQQEKLYELGKSKGLFESATVDDFKSAFQPQEELTPEMMETGQRNAAPAYAMTEEKYEAEKKSATESPLQGGQLPSQENTDSDFFDIISELEGFQGKLIQEGKLSAEYPNWKSMPNITDPAAKKEYNAIIDRYMEKYPDEVDGDDVWDVIKSRRKELEGGVSADVVEEPVAEGEKPVAKEEDLSDIITPKLIGKEEQEVVPFLNYQFGDEGFKFETSGIGDAMVAKFVDDEGKIVSEQEFDLDPFLTSTEVSESKRLQEWMSSQRASIAEAGIIKRAEDKLVKFRDRKQIATTLEEFSKEQEAFVESNKGLIAENMKYQEDLDRYNAMVSEYNDANIYDAEAEAKIKAEADRLQSERDRLVGLEDGVKSVIEGYQKRSDLLKRSVGSFDKYIEGIDTPTGPIDATRKFIGGFYDNMIRGISEWAAGESTFYVETALNALPVESYVSPEIIEQQRKEGLSDSQIKDEAIRTFKKELLPAVRTGMEEIIGSDTTEEYVKKIEGGEGKINMILGSILGSAKSTPIMALHLASALSPMPAGKGGKALTIGQRIKKAFTSPVSILSTKFMGAQVADALDQEMANSPAFEGVSENEKMLVKYPVAIVSGLLEEYGASSIVNKTGLPQKLTLEILKKMGKGASAKTFKEFAEKEIKSRAARGGITFISGMLSEFETGGLQELATVGAKKIYSLQKEQEMFPEMDEQGNYVDSPKILSMQMAGQILDAAAREAIGGGFFSTIPALSSALSNDYYFNSISDEQFELFNSLINTKEGKIGVINDLKNKITAGEITQEEGKRMLDDVNKIQAALDKIPSDYSAANKKKALSLIMRQDAIKRDVAGKDENLTKRQRSEIEKINQMLEDTDQQAFLEKERQDAIQEQGPEGMDVQEPTRDSEAVGEGDVRETTEEGRPKITVTEETQEVTDETLKDLENVPEPVIRGLAVKNINGEALTEQEQQVFEAQQEAVEQMASDIEQAAQAKKEGVEVMGQESAAQAEQRKKDISFQVNRAKRAISKILPNVEIVVHDTMDSFNAAVPPKGKGNRGAFIGNKIHINMSNANTRTVSHEVFHAVVTRALGGGVLGDKAATQLTNKMLAAVERGAGSKVLGKTITMTDGTKVTVRDYIKGFAKRGYEEAVQSEEELAELAGYLASEFTELDVNAKTAIKAWIGKLAEKLGINKALGTKIYSREMTDKDAIDLLNAIAGKSAKGEIIKEAKTLEEMFGDEEIAESDKAMDARFQKPIKATVDFKSRTGRTFSVSKEFRNQQHLDNYIKLRERKGDKEIGVTIDEAKEVEAPKPQKRRFAKKAVVETGTLTTGTVKLEIGRLNPIMIDGQEFARMTSVDIPTDNRFASTEMDLYTKAVDLAVSEGLGGVVIPKSVFNEVAVNENRFDAKKRGNEFVVTPKKDSVLTARFQADYTDQTTGWTYLYDKNTVSFKRLEAQGFIKKGMNINDFNGLKMLLHQPDAMFAGQVLNAAGERIVRGKGGMYYPILFHEENLFWASTPDAVERMVQILNSMIEDNGGRILMGITTAPPHKLLSSTTGANAMMDIYSNAVLDDILGLSSEDVKTNLINAANKNLGMSLTEDMDQKQVISKIREQLDPEITSFKQRGGFSEQIAKDITKEASKSQESMSKFEKFFLEGAKVDFFEMKKNKDGTFQSNTLGFKKFMQGISAMMSEPILKDFYGPQMEAKEKSGHIYGVIEVTGPVKPASVTYLAMNRLTDSQRSAIVKAAMKDGLQLKDRQKKNIKSSVWSMFYTKEMSDKEKQKVRDSLGLNFDNNYDKTMSLFAESRGISKKEAIETYAVENYLRKEHPDATGDLADAILAMTENTHESYPMAVQAESGVTLNLFDTAVQWDAVSTDPDNNKVMSDKDYDNRVVRDGKETTRQNQLFGRSIGVSSEPLRINTKNLGKEHQVSSKYQAPASTAFTIYDVINELRGKGYTDSAIALFLSREINPDTQKNFTKEEIKDAMAVPIDIENTLPSAFGDVEGGIAQGQKMFTEVMEKVRRSAARMRPANSSKIRAKAHQILMAHPDFDKQSATVKNRLILGLDSALGTTANKAIQAEISAIKKMIKGGKMSLKELKAAQVRLRAMIRKELPNDKAYSKTVVNNLIKMVTDATPETMDQVVNDVTSTINEQRSEKFISEIEGILNQKFETTQAGRKKGAKVTATFADAISFAKSKLAEIRKASENEDDFQTIMDKTRAERDALFSEIDTMTEEDISMVLAYDLVLQYGKTFVESNTEQDTVDGLELSLDMAKDLINTGRAFMKDQLRMAHEAYKEQFNTAFEDITGIDVRGMDEDQRADVSGSFRVGAEQRGKNLSNAAKAMMRVVDRANKFFAKNEDLAGFMDILSRGAGEMFGGKLQELVKQRVDDSSTVFKRGMMDMRSMVEAKQREIFGKNWKKVMANNRVPIKTGLTAFGKDLTYSQNEMYYLYNMAKDPANHPSFEKKFGKEWREVMDGIEALMTPEIKEWADWQVNEFYPMMWERYNPVYRRIYRTNLGWNKFYAGKIYRQSVDGSEDIDLLEQKMGPSMSVAGGSTKHRVKNNRPIAAVDGNLAMGRYLEEMEKFRAYQETVRDVSKLFNNEDIKNAIIEKYGKDFHNLFSTMLERYLTGKTEKGKLGSIVGTGNRVFIFAKLGYNLSLVWKQLTSIPTYANDIGFVNWGVYAAKAATARKVLSKEMYENSTYLQDRYAGDFMGVVDVFSKNKENAMSVGAGADFYINEASDAVTRYGMLYTKAGDALAIFLGGSPNYLYYKDQFKKKNPNATEQEAINYAIKKFEKDTRGTQQSSDIQDRDFYQTGNEFVRSMMLFTTSPRQYWRKSMSGYRQLYRKMKGVPSKGSITDNLRTIVMYRFMMPMLYTWATMGFPPPWDLDDEEQDELMWSALLGNISALFIIGHIGIALKDFMTDKPWAGRMPLPPIMQIASDMIDTMRSISKTKDPLERSIKEEEMYMKMVSNVVPSKNLDKSFGNWYRTASGDQDFNALKMAGYSDYIADRDERQMKEEMDAILKMFEQVNKDKGSGSRELKEIKELKEIR